MVIAIMNSFLQTRLTSIGSVTDLVIVGDISKVELNKKQREEEQRKKVEERAKKAAQRGEKRNREGNQASEDS